MISSYQGTPMQSLCFQGGPLNQQNAIAEVQNPYQDYLIKQQSSFQALQTLQKPRTRNSKIAAYTLNTDQGVSRAIEEALANRFVLDELD